MTQKHLNFVQINCTVFCASQLIFWDGLTLEVIQKPRAGSHLPKGMAFLPSQQSLVG